MTHFAVAVSNPQKTKLYLPRSIARMRDIACLRKCDTFRVSRQAWILSAKKRRERMPLNSRHSKKRTVIAALRALQSYLDEPTDKNLRHAQRACEAFALPSDNAKRDRQWQKWDQAFAKLPLRKKLTKPRRDKNVAVDVRRNKVSGIVLNASGQTKSPGSHAS